MQGRKLASGAALLIGVVSFFMPLVIVSVGSQGDLKWSGYSLTTQVAGFASENFWDIATTIVYGNDSASTSSNIHASAGESASSEGMAGPIAALAMLIAVVVAYCDLIALTLMVAARYSPRGVSGISLVGLLAAVVALISFFILADASSAHYGGAAGGWIVGLNAGTGLYALVGCFVAVFLVQRISAFDRILSPAME